MARNRSLVAALARSSASPGLHPPAVRVLWIARFDYRPRAQVEIHQHRCHFQWFLVLSGNPEFTLGLGIGKGEARHGVAEGASVLVPPGCRHGLTAGRRGVATLDVKFAIDDANLAQAVQAAGNAPRADPTRAADLRRASRKGRAAVAAPTTFRSS